MMTEAEKRREQQRTEDRYEAVVESHLKEAKILSEVPGELERISATISVLEEKDPRAAVVWRIKRHAILCFIHLNRGNTQGAYEQAELSNKKNEDFKKNYKGFGSLTILREEAMLWNRVCWIATC